jgi:ATP-dependent RNA helicase RhlB
MVKVETEEVTSESINQFAFCPANEQKISLLVGLINSQTPERSIVFVNTKRSAEKLADYLAANGHKTALLSGDVPQEKRQRLLADFQESKVTIMIATDVAARGLHIPDVSHVFNFDLPQDAEDYVHRVGRTARVNAKGEAVTFVIKREMYKLKIIEDLIESEIPKLQPPEKIGKGPTWSTEKFNGNNKKKFYNKKNFSKNKNKGKGAK